MRDRLTFPVLAGVCIVLTLRLPELFALPGLLLPFSFTRPSDLFTMPDLSLFIDFAIIFAYLILTIFHSGINI
jgi:hypothetical protein